MSEPSFSPENIQVHSKVFYPSHGAGEVISEKFIEFAGEKLLYYEFEFINKKLTISTPVQNLGKLGVRPVHSPKVIRDLISNLKSNPNSNPQTTDYNQFIEKVKELDMTGKLTAFIEIIQYCNHIKKMREKEGRLIPVSVTKYIKNSIQHLVSELAVAAGLEYDNAEVEFRQLSGLSF